MLLISIIIGSSLTVCFKVFLLTEFALFHNIIQHENWFFSPARKTRNPSKKLKISVSYGFRSVFDDKIQFPKHWSVMFLRISPFLPGRMCMLPRSPLLTATVQVTDFGLKAGNKERGIRLSQECFFSVFIRRGDCFIHLYLNYYSTPNLTN